PQAAHGALEDLRRSALISSAPQGRLCENPPLHNPDRLLPGHLPGAVSPRCRAELLSGAEPPEQRNHQSTPDHCRQQSAGTGILRPKATETCHCSRILANPHGDDRTARTSLQEQRPECSRVSGDGPENKTRSGLTISGTRIPRPAPSLARWPGDLLSGSGSRSGHQPQKWAVQGFAPGSGI